MLVEVVWRAPTIRDEVNAAQHQRFRQGAEKHIFVRVRHGPLRDGVHFAVDGEQIAFDRTLVECRDMRHLDGLSRAAFIANMLASTV